MRSFALVGSLAFVGLLASSRQATACGAPFGKDTRLEPAQTIVASFANGEERYELNPQFCGKGADFGLVLPVPAPPSKAVALGDPELRAQLDSFSAPRVITTYSRYCPSGSSGDGALGGVPNRGGTTDSDGTKGAPGVDVVDAGTVGFLDYEVIKADSQTSLTDYLDQNAFPYDSKARDAFAAYVTRGWYFVAFKISAAPTAPTGGRQLCGSLGPLVVTFPTTTPVIPTRIVTGDTQQRWRIYSLADQNRTPKGGAGLTLESAFSGAIASEDLTHYPALAAIGRVGQRVTRHEIRFYGGASNPGDLTLEIASEPNADYRPTEYRSESVADEAACSGCAVASTSGGDDQRTSQGLLAACLVGVAAWLAKRR